MDKKYRISKMLVSIAIILASNHLKAQNYQAAIAAADTSRFSVNKAGGWQLFNSHVNNVSMDSVCAEVVLQHSNNINWQQLQLVGKIKFIDALPKVNKVMPFRLLNNGYLFQVQTDGSCYLSFVNGIFPATTLLSYLL